MTLQYIYVCCTNLRKINGYFLLHHWLTGFSNRDLCYCDVRNKSLNTNQVNIGFLNDETFKACRLLYLPPGFAFNNSAC